jgi:hypothetical protein
MRSGRLPTNTSTSAPLSVTPKEKPIEEQPPHESIELGVYVKTLLTLPKTDGFTTAPAEISSPSAPSTAASAMSRS